MDPNWLLEKIILAVPLLLSLSVHELAHARTALAFGDPTAKRMGRCTLNPLAHLDPVGTLALLFCGFGWAKPVPVNPHNLHPPRAGSVAVSVAGPLSNLILAILAALLLRGMLTLEGEVPFPGWNVLELIAIGTMGANICLGLFNLIPLYPLDGHHIVREQLSADSQVAFMRWQLRYGRVLLMAIILGPRVASLFNVEIFDPVRLIYEQGVNLFVNYIIIPG